MREIIPAPGVYLLSLTGFGGALFYIGESQDVYVRFGQHRADSSVWKPWLAPAEYSVVNPRMILLRETQGASEDERRVLERDFINAARSIGMRLTNKRNAFCVRHRQPKCLCDAVTDGPLDEQVAILKNAKEFLRQSPNA